MKSATECNLFKNPLKNFNVWQTAAMKILILLFTLAQLVSFSHASERIDPFTSDGCSLWPEGPRSNPNLWRECCFVHDMAYWMGGPKSERLAADKRLKACVKSRGEDLNSILMYIGVRMGGTPFLNTSYRWGYGWPFHRGYKEISPAEREMVRDELIGGHLTEEEKIWVTKFWEERGF